MLFELANEFKQLIREANPTAQALYEPLTNYLARGGKQLRPHLCALCAEIVGGTAEQTHHAGLAIELFHNFTLIHDDIEDNSLLRRGQPCLHVQEGIPIALNLGDLLFCLSTQTLLNAPYKADEKIMILQTLYQQYIKIFEGQSTELSWHHHKKWNLNEQDYFTMIEQKTGILIATACKIGAYLGGASPKEQEILYQWGLSLGVAFQIQDDVLNIIGTEEKYKKEIGGDITEGKRSLMVLHTLNNQEVSQQDKQKLQLILDSKTTIQQDILWCIELLKTSGAVAYAQKKSSSLIQTTTHQIATTFSSNAAREKLLFLAHSLITREV